MGIAQSLDHFVVPVDDLVTAEEFYVRVFGGVLVKRKGLKRTPTKARRSAAHAREKRCYKNSL